MRPLMGMEVLAVVGEIGLIQRAGNGLDIAQEQIVRAGGSPTLSLAGVIGKKRLGSLRQMGTGVIPIDHLGTVGGDVGVLSIGDLALEGQRPQSRTKGRTVDSFTVAAG
jgi:hypothetical protein